jgi:hypothetical protein
MSTSFPTKVSKNCTLDQLRDEAQFRGHNLGNVPLSKSQLVDLLGNGSTSAKAAARGAAVKQSQPSYAASSARKAAAPKVVSQKVAPRKAAAPKVAAPKATAPRAPARKKSVLVEVIMH